MTMIQFILLLIIDVSAALIVYAYELIRWFNLQDTINRISQEKHVNNHWVDEINDLCDIRKEPRINPTIERWLNHV